MLSGFRQFALEVWFLEEAVAFYRDHLDLAILDRTDAEVTFDVGGGHRLVLREPGPLPRGGLHVHYALRVPLDHYESWLSTLADLTPSEHDFGTARSLYVYDVDDHCVELAGVPGDGVEAPLDGVFEVVLEVESLAIARDFYTDLGFEVADVGTARERVRLDGPIALELWMPQRGLADARGGVHCDLTFVADDPEASLAPVADRVTSERSVEGGRRVRDPDGHYLTVLGPEANPD